MWCRWKASMWTSEYRFNLYSYRTVPKDTLLCSNSCSYLKAFSLLGGLENIPLVVVVKRISVWTTTKWQNSGYVFTSSELWYSSLQSGSRVKSNHSKYCSWLISLVEHIISKHECMFISRILTWLQRPQPNIPAHPCYCMAVLNVLCC